MALMHNDNLVRFRYRNHLFRVRKNIFFWLKIPVLVAIITAGHV